MPEISRFHGIIVRMFHDDNGPPHFHARYAEYTVRVDIPSGVVEGRFPPGALRHLLVWYHRRRPELMENWRLVSDRKKLKRIAPLP